MLQENTNRWMTPRQFADEFAIAESTQGKMRSKREIPFSKIGGKFIRYDRLLIDKWFEDHTVEAQFKETFDRHN